MSGVKESEASEDVETKKKSSKLLLFAALGAVLLGGGVFAGIFLGVIPVPAALGGKDAAAAYAEGDSHAEAKAGQGHDGSHKPPPKRASDASFVVPGFMDLDALVISLGPNAHARHLRAAFTLETAPDALEAVAALRPRILDVLNTYLRAVDERDFEAPHAMPRLRAQMLRRVQLVTPPGSVSDVLIREFVLN